MSEAHPKVLAFYLGPREAYRDVLFSQSEVFCSPDCAPSGEPDRPRTVRTPIGQYDVRRVLEKLPRAAWPEVVVVKGDGTLRNLPHDLGVLDCRKVLVLGDTHHLGSSITALLNYALTERFDVILTDTNRQHVHFFRSAGFTHTHWLPCLTWTPHWHDVSDHAEHDVVFVGQAGAFHPWRRALLRAVSRRGLPVRVETLPQDEAARRYARSKVVLNCSLNGDVNLRTFEVLAAGGLLLTDELRGPSGLSLLFEAGRHVVTYRSVDDLVERAHYYLDRPDLALTIRRQGRAYVEATFAPHVQRRRFWDLVSDARVDPALSVEDPRAASVAMPMVELVPRVAAYEWVQELHRTSAKVRVFAADVESSVVENIRDLPRLTAYALDSLAELRGESAVFTSAPDEPSVEDVLLVDPKTSREELDPLLATFFGRHVVVERALTSLSLGDMAELVALLRGWGFSLVSLDAFAFQRSNPIASLDAMKRLAPPSAVLRAVGAIIRESNDAEACYRGGVAASELDDVKLGETGFEKAARLDRGHEGAAAALRGQRSTLRPSVASPPAVQMPIQAGPRRRYLVVTNLFPPEELGGYGRKIWAFTASLSRRGHEVRVVCGAAPYLERLSAEDARLSVRVDRYLQLTGKWEQGTMKVLGDPGAIAAVASHNRAAVMGAVREFVPDVCLLGNMDFLEMDLLRALLGGGVPVLHSIGAASPGYSVEEAPRTRLYHPLPASGWVAEQLKSAGYPFDSMTVAYPGAQLEDFQRDLAPWPRGLRIAYAGLMLPFKGPHVLLQALAILRHEGIDFRCEMAGDTTSPEFIQKVEQFVSGAGLSERVKLLGFQDRTGLRRLFDRSNVFVFPSLVPEAFGISPVEAMAAGLAIVTTATGGAGEVVDGESALIVEPNNPAELAERLRRLHEDPALCERLGEAARRRASAFSVETGVDRIEAAAEQVLAAVERPLAYREDEPGGARRGDSSPEAESGLLRLLA